MRPKTAVIIAAAGTGSRFRSEMPKQFCKLIDDLPVLAVTQQRLQSCMPESDVYTVLHPDWVKHWNLQCSGLGIDPGVIIFGGATRWESIHNALLEIPNLYDLIMVHDAARPLVQAHVINSIYDHFLNGAHAVVPTIAVTDSLRTCGANSHAVDRSLYRAVQTPQAFDAQILRKAYSNPYRPDYTDDASVVEASFGEIIELVDGDPSTLKITHPSDLAAVRAML